MKNTVKKTFWKACVPIVGLALIGFGFFGCGKADDPNAVTVSDLKYPASLTILDEGNGNVKLSWVGLNNEKDFDGYNIYGMKGTATDLGVVEGTALKLLDEKGEAVAASKAVLQKFNYDPTDGYKLEKVGTKTDADKEFSYFPIHTKSGEDPLLPTCKPASGQCVATTAANLGKTIGDLASMAPNGAVYYSVTGLIPGSSYCFFVLSSMDKGKKVSQTSSPVACVVPRYSVTATNIAANKSASPTATRALDLKALRTACAAGNCGTVALVAHTQGGTAAAATDWCDKTSDQALCFEVANATLGIPNITAGKNSAIQDLGYYANGFADEKFPAKLPALSTWSADLQNLDGYSLSGQSIPLYKNRVYVIATDETTTSGNPTQFYYHLLWVTSVSDNNVNFELRLSNLVNNY